ncbi:MAG: preprotein translocase subunit SecA, partial [Candidatus Moranbacteria bacterium]|nr:preprotein translocase subunit SecA [Candidatus Moranbacteria bacterium]
MSILKKIFGSNEREIGKLKPLVEKINSWEEQMVKLSDDQLRAKTVEFKKRIAENETLDELLPEAFAVVRETVKRVDNKRLFDVQMMGGIVLHSGKIAEMKTGEGKTHTSLLPMYLNALTGKGVHLVTVNDYLAKRDCNWMGGILHFLGISTACIIHDASYIYQPKVMDDDEVSVETLPTGRQVENLAPITRREAYAADITYGTNNEFGFDYLRDNMVPSLEHMAQRELNYVIVDEVDSILIDEARTPLIISAADSESTKMYEQFAMLVPRLKREEDFTVEEKTKSVTITESGIAKIESWLNVGNIYEAGKITYVHHLEQALKAQVIFQLDRDYVVKDGEVIIVDDFTGRLMPGRRYSEGLHQAIEAKEHVRVQKESKTLATITFQNYFRMYQKISGMTGTASTSAEEFFKVYKMDVTEIPTNKPAVRKDIPDVVYKSEKGKFNAIVEKIKEVNKAGQPILVGTIAVEKSEYLSTLLLKSGVEHEVLNAKNHEREAQIVAKAGHVGSVTIATNMAGRGTDIKLGEGARELGGLFILGTERHEARRIDNQLRGRAGRQGDPGMSQFFVSLEDELMRRFGGDNLISLMTKLGLPEDQPIQNPIISKTIENAQSKIEGFNFDIRKHILDYDDVMNKQREILYKKRRAVLEVTNIKPEIMDNIRDEIERAVSSSLTAEDGNLEVEKIAENIHSMIALPPTVQVKLKEIVENRNKNTAELIGEATDYLAGVAKEIYNFKEKEVGEENMRSIERSIALQTIDVMWMSHLDEIDYLREGIGLRGYGQRDPLVEYKREAFAMFSYLMENIKSTIVHTIFRVSAAPVQQTQSAIPEKNLNFSGAAEAESFSAAREIQDGEVREAPKQKPIINNDKIGRNDPCPCGSGKKYKKCCG